MNDGMAREKKKTTCESCATGYSMLRSATSSVLSYDHVASIGDTLHLPSRSDYR